MSMLEGIRRFHPLFMGVIVIIITLSVTSFASTENESRPFSCPYAGNIQLASVNKSASEQNVWENKGVANTDVVGGHWLYTITVRTTEYIQPHTNHLLALTLQSEDDSRVLETIRFTMPQTVSPGEEMTFSFDVGDALDETESFICTID